MVSDKFTNCPCSQLLSLTVGEVKNNTWRRFQESASVQKLPRRGEPGPSISGHQTIVFGVCSISVASHLFGSNIPNVEASAGGSRSGSLEPAGESCESDSESDSGGFASRNSVRPWDGKVPFDESFRFLFPLWWQRQMRIALFSSLRTRSIHPCPKRGFATIVPQAQFKAGRRNYRNTDSWYKSLIRDDHRLNQDWLMCSDPCQQNEPLWLTDRRLREYYLLLIKINIMVPHHSEVKWLALFGLWGARFFLPRLNSDSGNLCGWWENITVQ